MKKSILTRSQTKKLSKVYTIDGNDYMHTVTIRYDDECGNGHNTFAITSDIRENGREYMGGCCHEEIAEHFPELKKYIKWHSVSADSPMYYKENTLYHARDREDMTKPLNAPLKFNTMLKFENMPFTFKEQTKNFWKYLDNIKDFSKIKLIAIKYDGQDNYNFNDNYSFTGFIDDAASKKWYLAPFNDKVEASEFLEALQQNKFSYIKIAYEFNTAVKPNLKAARSCAIWDDATLEQLQDVKALNARLPQLMKDFKKDIKELGFIY